MFKLNEKKSILIIILISIICVSLLFIVEQVLNMPYSLKTIVKIPFFILIPFVIKRFLLKEKLSFYIDKKNLTWVLFCSIFVMSVVIVAFIIVNEFIDTSLIAQDVKDRMKITKSMFIFAAAYTILGNSFIEEYFFRGFVFQSLYNKGLTKLAYSLSALLFALYHIGIFMTWFTLPIMFLVLVGLFTGGLIFSYFVQRTKSVLASYFIHMSADIAIILIAVFGIQLFS